MCLVSRAAIDVELVRPAVCDDERAQAAADVHEILGEAVAGLGDEARAVVDERAELGAADVAGRVAHVRAGVEVADDEVERMRERQPHVALGAEHVQHAPARAAAVEVTIERRAPQRALGDLARALDDVDQRRCRARRLFLAQLDHARERGLGDRARLALVLARPADERAQAAALEARQPALQRPDRHVHGAPIGPRDLFARGEAQQLRACTARSSSRLGDQAIADQRACTTC